MTDRDTFVERIRRYKQEGEKALLSTGATVDEALVGELRTSGSDQRFGVNLVCRPNNEVVNRITAIQRRLFDFEPRQYYYPAPDLHLTLFEICHSRAQDEADRIARVLESLAPDLLHTNLRVALDEPSLAYDASGAALNFLPCDGQLQQLRNAIARSLTRNGVPVNSRYAPESAHITLLRYTAPLQTPVACWVEVLNQCDATLAEPWILSSWWLTWGGNWYGMQARVSQRGPFTIGP